jgi:tape measure domain-containing protein
MTTVGEAFIDVRPDTSRFAPETQGAVNGALARVKSAMRGALGGIESDAANSGRRVGLNLGEGVTSGADKATTSVGRLGASIERIGLYVAGYQLASWFERAGSAAIGAAANFQQLQVAFTGIFGSADKANNFLKELQQFAKVTPFNFQELAKDAQALLAVGYAAQDIVPMLTTIGNAAADLGAGTDAIHMFIVALNQMKGRGRADAQDLNQMTQDLPGFNAYMAIAAGEGISVAKAQDLVASGTLNADRAIQDILVYMGRMPGAMGAMDRQSRTLAGAFSNVQDAAQQMAVKALTPIVPTLTRLVTAFANLEANHPEYIFGALVGLVSALAIAFSGTVASAIAVIAPLAALIAVIVGISEGIIYAYENFTTFRDVVDDVGGHIATFAANSQKAIAGFADRATVAITRLVGQANRLEGPFRAATRAVVGAFEAVSSPITNILHGLGDDFAAAASYAQRGVNHMGGLIDHLGDKIHRLRQQGLTGTAINLTYAMGLSPAQQGAVVGAVAQFETQVNRYVLLIQGLGQQIKHGYISDAAENVLVLFGLSPGTAAKVIAEAQHVADAVRHILTLDFHGAALDVANLLGLSPPQTAHLLATISTIKRAVADLFYGNVKGAVTNVGELLGLSDATVADINTKVALIRNTISSLFHGHLGVAVENIGELLGISPKTVAAMIQDVQVIKGLVADATGFIHEHWGAISNFLKGSVVPVLLAIGKVWLASGIIAAIGAVGEAIGAVIGVFSGLVAALSAPIVVITAVVAAVIYAYQHFKVFRDVVDTVVGFVLTTFGNLAQFFVTEFPAAIEAATHIFNVLRDVVGAVVAVIVFLWDHGLNNILRIVVSVWNTVTGVVTGAVKVIENIIKLVLDIINGDWGKAWNDLVGILQGVWQIIWSIVTGAFGVLEGIVLAGLGLIAAAFRGIWNSLVAVVSGAFSLVVAAVRTGVEGVISTFRSVVGFVVNIGKDIVLGLRDGIVAAWHFVTDKVGELVNLIPKKIRDFLGITSPSKVTHELGLFTGQGFADGLAKMKGAVATSAATLAKAAVFTPPPLDYSLAAGGTNRPGLGQQVTKQYNLNLTAYDTKSVDVVEQFRRMERLSL